MSEAAKNSPKILIFVLAIVAAFFAGVTWEKQQTDRSAVAVSSDASVVFAPKQSKTPNFKFFVMSYCPYGNQAENGLRPVADLMGDKVEFEPHYIINKMSADQVNQMCVNRVYNEKLCQQYIDQGYFPDQETCKQQFYTNEEECFDKETEQCLAAEDGSFYCSLHGKSELNQNIREICAWNSTKEKSKWWAFVDLANNECGLANIDQCWQEKAKAVGLDENQIQECFNKNAIELLDKEIALTKEFGVSGSPSLFINDTAFPPEGAYDQTGRANMQIGDQVFNQSEYRSPEVFKQAVCAAFSRRPKECKQELSRTNEVGSGSCN